MTYHQSISTILSYYYAADADISIGLLGVLRRKVQEMRDQLALVQSPREIIDIELTPAQLTGVFLISYISL